jgi:hypothetical protein
VICQGIDWIGAGGPQDSACLAATLDFNHDLGGQVGCENMTQQIKSTESLTRWPIPSTSILLPIPG